MRSMVEGWRMVAELLAVGRNWRENENWATKRQDTEEGVVVGCARQLGVTEKGKTEGVLVTMKNMEL